MKKLLLLLLLAMPVYAGPPFAFWKPASGGVTVPVATYRWKLNDGTGTTAADSIAGNTANLSSGTSWTTGPNSDGALAIAGTGGGGSGGVGVFNSATSSSSTFTISLWFDWMTGGDTDPGLFCNGSYHGIYLRTSVGYGFFDGSFENISATVPSQNAWHHLLFSCTGGTGTLYLDGVSVGTCSVSGAQSFTQFGGLQFDVFVGSLDDVQFWGATALTGPQAAAVYSAGAQ